MTTIYYAVHIGKLRGIFYSWNDAKEAIGQLNSFPQPRFKKFTDLILADLFVKYGDEMIEPSSSSSLLVGNKDIENQVIQDLVYQIDRIKNQENNHHQLKNNHHQLEQQEDNHHHQLEQRDHKNHHHLKQHSSVSQYSLELLNKVNKGVSEVNVSINNNNNNNNVISKEIAMRYGRDGEKWIKDVLFSSYPNKSLIIYHDGNNTAQINLNVESKMIHQNRTIKSRPDIVVEFKDSTVICEIKTTTTSKKIDQFPLPYHGTVDQNLLQCQLYKREEDKKRVYGCIMRLFFNDYSDIENQKSCVIKVWIYDYERSDNSKRNIEDFQFQPIAIRSFVIYNNFTSYSSSYASSNDDGSDSDDNDDNERILSNKEKMIRKERRDNIKTFLDNIRV